MKMTERCVYHKLSSSANIGRNDVVTSDSSSKSSNWCCSCIRCYIQLIMIVIFIVVTIELIASSLLFSQNNNQIVVTTSSTLSNNDFDDAFYDDYDDHDDHYNKNSESIWKGEVPVLADQEQRTNTNTNTKTEYFVKRNKEDDKDEWIFYHNIAHFVAIDVEGNHRDIFAWTCAKCGSSSFYDTMYEVVNGKKWNYQGPPWVQSLFTGRWNGYPHWTFPKSSEEHFNKILQRNTTSSYLLIRDPRQRLLSAFKSKITCDPGFRPNVPGRTPVVESLLDLSHFWDQNQPLKLPSNNKNTSCLSLDDYLHAMKIVHQRGKQGELNPHLKPQSLVFSDLRISPQDLDVITEISKPGAAGQLFDTFGKTRKYDDFPRRHSSSEESLNVTTEQDKILTYLTRDEYDLLRPYLQSQITKNKLL